MAESNDKYPWEPWDSYGNGSTRPPKNRGGLIALLLGVVIFLGGITVALSVLNVRLFSRLSDTPDSSSPVIFHDTGTEDTAASTAGTEPDASTDATQPQSLPSAVGEMVLSPAPEGQENVPQEGGLSLQEIYLKNIPSVVSITCTLSDGAASGTGVVLSENGYIVTNAHVIEDAQTISVLLTDTRTFSAQVVGSDGASDLAVLYVAADDLTPAEFGDSSLLQVGDVVVAIGDPLGVEFRGTMTDGIISAINRDVVTDGRTMTLIQTNAALNSGNSGGPLINCYGQVIGINTMKISTLADSAGVEGLGFAIPSATVKEVVDQLLEQGYVSGRASLELEGEWISEFDQHFRRLPAGFYITGVPEDSSAAQIGLTTGDILLTLDGVRLTDEDDLESVLYAHQAGDTVEITYYRSGATYTASLVLGEYHI